MKVSKIYADSPFQNVEFSENGLNVVIGKISDRDNNNISSHNLGKSLLMEIIDFLLLKGIDKKEQFFLTRNEKFKYYTFFAEIVLNNGKYLIIKRNVDNNTKVSFKLNIKRMAGFDIEIDKWDFENIPFDKAKEKLNEYLCFDVLPNFKYRKTINYFIRHQNDYMDVFRLSKHRGKDREWKPIVFELLGFNGDLINEKLDMQDEFNEQKSLLEILQKENSITIEEEDKIIGLIEIKENEHNDISSNIDKFNFYTKDNLEKEDLVNNIEAKIQIANTEHYAIKYEIDKIQKSMNNEISTIDIDDIKKIYEETKIYFPQELLNEYEKVIEFNKQITYERNKYLVKNLEIMKDKEKELKQELNRLESEKSSILMYITEKSSYDKFKKYQKELSKAEADILILKEKLNNISKMAEIKNKISKISKSIEEKINELHSEILKNKHKNIRKLFNDFTICTLNTPANLSLSLNRENNIQFEADYTNGEQLLSTDEGKGNTYKKILCAAFDVALLQEYNKKSFYKFAYHDGILDGLDIRIKEKYLEYVRRITKEYDIQYILTVIESEVIGIKKEFQITNEEIVLMLSDESCKSKLFRQCF